MIRVALCALNARYTHTSLAIRSLSAYAEKHGRQAFSLSRQEWSINDRLFSLLQSLDHAKADVYAFSVYIWNSRLVRTLTAELKKIRPAAVIVWGGPEASTQAESFLQSDAAVDYILCGEGEVALTSLLDMLAVNLRPGPEQLSGLPNLAWRPDLSSPAVVNAPAPLLDADEWPFPWSDAELRRERNRLLYYESSRGCPFSCSYCLSSLDRSVRFRSLAKVQAELDCLIAAGVRQVKLVDRTFNCRPDRANRIWRHLIERYHTQPYETCFHFELAGDLLDDDSLAILQTAPPGLFQFEIGVQSAHPSVLRSVNRISDLAKLARQVDRLRQADNCQIHLDLIAGLPGENLALFGQSFNFVCNLRPHQLQLGFLKVLPGTQIRQTARELDFRWLDDAPYEVLQSDALSFADLCRLRQIEQLLDQYLNSTQYRAAAWLGRFWPGQWAFYNDLADSLIKQGLLAQIPGPEERLRRLLAFARACGRLDSRQTWLFIDLLRTDFQLGGQKGMPEWLSFFELSRDPQDKTLLRELRLQARLAAGRGEHTKLRFDRIRFAWPHYSRTGELSEADWLLVYDVSKGRPILIGDGPLDAGLPPHLSDADSPAVESQAR